MAKSYFKKGDYNAVCDHCGRVFKASQLTLNYRNLFLCKQDYEERNPQELVRARPERQGVPIARPYPEDREITAAESAGEGL